MRYLVHCPSGSKDKVEKQFNTAKFFDKEDRVIYLDTLIDRVFIEVIPTEEVKSGN